MAYTTILGLKCTLFLDYDCYDGDEPLRNLPDEGRIMWLEKRIQMILVRPFSKIYNRKSTACRELHVDYGLGRSTPFIVTNSVIMNTIEALGAYLVDHKRGEEECHKYDNFKAFMERYMPQWSVPVVLPGHGLRNLTDVLWKTFRNALAHEFAIKGASLEDLPGRQRYEVDGKIIRIDGTKFFRDFVRAQKAMFKDIRTNPTLKAYFLARFNYTYRC